MRVARIGTLYQPVPAHEYGGTQRSMAQMTVFQTALCAHNITLYAPSDSTIISFAEDIAQKLGLAVEVSADKQSIAIHNWDGRVGYIRLKSAGFSSTGYQDTGEAEKHDQLFQAFLRDEVDRPFDIIHCHTRRFMADDIIPRGLGRKTLVHQHNPTLEGSYQKHRYPLICISESQAGLMRNTYNANVCAVIHHGLDSFTHQLTLEDAGYLAWIGRFLPEKGAHRAIEIARASGMPLVMAGTIFDRKPESQPYFDEKIKPHIHIADVDFLNHLSHMRAAEVRREIAKIEQQTGIKNPVIFCGPADERQKQALYGHALATLFPISWSEPFGRVLIESMACGTPVIGYAQLGKIDCGSVAEVITDGITGRLISARNEADALTQAVSAVASIHALSRPEIRHVFEKRFSSEGMAVAIDALYRSHLRDTPSPQQRIFPSSSEPQ